VTSTSDASTSVPSAAMTSTIASRTAHSPSVGLYCSALADASAATPLMSFANSSDGKLDVSGWPPAREMTSGRSVIAMRSRIADDVIPRVRWEKRPA
jgi:hypothetical protein